MDFKFGAKLARGKLISKACLLFIFLYNYLGVEANKKHYIFCENE